MKSLPPSKCYRSMRAFSDASRSGAEWAREKSRQLEQQAIEAEDKRPGILSYVLLASLITFGLGVFVWAMLH